MPEKDPSTYSLLTYAWVSIMAMLGGGVSYWRKVRVGLRHPFSLTEFVGEIVTSGFVGIITFWLCEAGNIPPLITAAMVGVSGHMGSRAIFIFERWVEKKIEGWNL